MEEGRRISKPWAIAYIAVVAALCLAPSVGLLFGGGEESSDSDAAPAPALAAADGSFNFNVLSDAGSWFDDHFAFRNEWVTAAAVVEGSVFGVSPNESVVRGTNGWLYYGDSVDDFRGTGQLGDRALYDIAHSMKLVQDYAAARGIDFAFTIAPNKNTLYGANMPYYCQTKVGDANLDRIAAYLASEDVNYIDARTLLADQGKVLYHASDSHWNNEGAMLVADAIMSSMGHDHRNYFDVEPSLRDDFVGDLEKMLYPAAPAPEAEFDYGQQDYAYRNAAESNFSPRVETASVAENPAGSLVMYRDSFCNSLLPFMAEAYDRAYFSRGVPYQLAIDLDAHEADALVIERAQRFMRDMAANAPVMCAPVVPEADQPIGEYEPVEVEQETLGDYVKVTGSVPVEALPGDFIAVRVNGERVYEAFGVCDAETSQERFQVLLPASDLRESGNTFELQLF